MHIDLTEDNRTKYLLAGERLGMSVSEMCNRILAAVDTIDLSMAVRLSPKQNSDAQKEKVKINLSLKPRWSVRL